MAKKKQANEVDYVATTMNINYTIPKGLIFMLARVSNSTEKQVWCTLSEMANICAYRLSKRKGTYKKSWTTQVFPGTETSLRIDMDKYTPYYYNMTNGDREEKAPTYSARIKISGYTDETFTQKQVNEIMDDILLGNEEEVNEQ